MTQFQQQVIKPPKQLQIKMYRISNNNMFTGKTELQKAYLVFTGKNNYIINSCDDWKLVKDFPYGARLYYSKYIGQLHIFKKPLDDSYLKVLCDQLDEIDTNTLHPAYKSKFYGELKRLHSGADKKSEKMYSKFIDFLIKYYSIDKFQIKKKANYIDDIGPYLTPRVGLQKTTIPEFPEVFIAPKKWRYMMWIISNYFVGPYPKNKKNIYYSWNGYDISNIVKNDEDKAYMLYLISNFIIRHDAWRMNKSCDSCCNFIDLVTNQGFLPF